jgi:hypothetical protein
MSFQNVIEGFSECDKRTFLQNLMPWQRWAGSGASSMSSRAVCVYGLGSGLRV